MTTPMSDDELCARLRDTGLHSPNLAAARIEALIAERDAAVAQMQAALAERNKAEEWLQMAKSNTAEYERVVMAMGERRATAAIVGWLRGADLLHGVPWHGVDPHTSTFLANAIERGDHLTKDNPI